MTSFDEDKSGIDMAVELEWNDYDTGLFTQKLYRHVKNDEVSFELQAKPGSLLTDFGVVVAGGLTVKIIAGIGRYLLDRHQSAKTRGRDVPSPTVFLFIDGQEYEITVQDEEDVQEIKALAEIKAEREGDDGQQSIDDYRRDGEE